jgi:hypothetical protein
VTRTALGVVEIVLHRSEDPSARHALELLLSLSARVLEVVLLVLYQAIIDAPVTGTHHNDSSKCHVQMVMSSKFTATQIGLPVESIAHYK